MVEGASLRHNPLLGGGTLGHVALMESGVAGTHEVVGHRRLVAALALGFGGPPKL